MRQFWSSALLLLASIVGASAMEQIATPPKFPIPWAGSAGSAYVRSIPVTSQIGVQNCAASLADGFPPLTFVPASAGGCPPFGQDFNGALKQLSQGVQWQQAGGPIYYNSAFAVGIGGYPKGAVLQSAIVPGNFWISLIDNNSDDPDLLTSSNWAQAPFQPPTGTPTPSLTTFSLPGYVPANGRTVGNASSNATSRANLDTKILFVVIWASCDNTQCPIFTSGGAPTTRGADAITDYAANKAISVWNLNGTGLMGADSVAGTTSTNLVGVPVASGSRTAPGSVLGENLHVLTAGEAPTITSSNASQSISVSGTTNVSGSVSGTVNVSGSVSGTTNVSGNVSGTVNVSGSVSGTVNVSGSVSGTTNVSGDVSSGASFIPLSTGGISSLQTAGAGTTNITPANSSGSWAGVHTLSGTMSGSNTLSGTMSGSNTLSGTMSGVNTLPGTMSGSNTMSGTMSGSNTLPGTMSGSNTMSGANSISTTSNNTGGAGHNTVARAMVVYWNLKL